MSIKETSRLFWAMLIGAASESLRGSISVRLPTRFLHPYCFSCISGVSVAYDLSLKLPSSTYGCTSKGQDQDSDQNFKRSYGRVVIDSQPADKHDHQGGQV